ncbi:hypothetical protein GCM10010289_62130 [Streptomyces violascens]|uniref:Uncharacterized protein n=1 Tax=Streptomyces violascens TaxID=67381 RepID=A0ABQ3R291_9ACTN|nr:hypothetical protein GCM10010289_62130 [Streptomyces violascens]GHI43638.1 hypothetical protein Sviol_80460 [Streptomyces violascens]
MQFQIGCPPLEAKQSRLKIPLVTLPDQLVPERHVVRGMGEQRERLPYRLAQLKRIMQGVTHFIEFVLFRPGSVDDKAVRRDLLPAGEEDLRRIHLVGTGRGYRRAGRDSDSPVIRMLKWRQDSLPYCLHPSAFALTFDVRHI